MKYLKKSAACIAAAMLAANSLGYMPYNAVDMPAFTANAADIVVSGDCGAEGDNVKWQLDSEGTLTISGTGVMKSWALNSPWSEYSANISKVIIEKGVTAIGEQTFSGCGKITEITIPDSVTNIKTGAFFECAGLTSIEIPESVTEMGHSVFYGCVNLKEITLPSGVETINSGVFRDCESLETITFSKNVTKVDFAALCNCSNLKSVTFENPECKIADAEYTICNSHDFDTKENVFNGEIHGYANSTAQAYAEKYSRKFVALEEKPAAEIVASGDCGAEGDNVKWQLDSEGTLTISGEGEMKRFSYSSPAPWKTESIKKLVVENGVTNIVKEAFVDCPSLTSVTISDSVTTIGEAAFKNCSLLTSINIPKNVTIIDNETFKGCSGLASITIPDGVTAIKSLAFEDCSNLTSVVIPDSVISIEYSAFYYCNKLTSITIPDSVTAIGGAVFAKTPWLETKKKENPFVIVNNILIDGTACKGDITIPDNVVCIADYSFQANLELTSATIPDSITNIGNSIFSYCSNLTSVTIPNSITVIPGAMFENCQKLNKITLPESIKTIGTNAFFNCSELNSITIENSECVIEDSEKTICNTYDISTKETGFTGTIYGYPNSTAQAYAEKYSRKFVAIEEKPTTADLGDVNVDGKVDSSDASAVLAEYANVQTGGAGEFTESQLKSADVNSDGKIDSSDASKILAYYAMISTGKEPSWD